ncbi:MAG: hypothetical protein KDA86_24735 [Planctomycetaceae bacterium]|nr:hypothetical protein [Planctomycetaceae bacterium]
MTLRDIHRDLVTVASQEKSLNPKRRKMLERAIDRSADLIAAETPPGRRWRLPKWKLATVSAIMGIVAALVTILSYWL